MSYLEREDPRGKYSVLMVNVDFTFFIACVLYDPPKREDAEVIPFFIPGLEDGDWEALMKLLYFAAFCRIKSRELIAY